MIGTDKTLFDSVNRLCIPTVHYRDMWPTALKTRHHKNFNRDPKLFSWEAGMATSAAPTYFPAFRASDGRSFWDGGLWANDPTLVGVAEALGVLGQRASEIEVLAIGTTRTVQNPPESLASGGARRLLTMRNNRLLNFMWRLSEHASLALSKILTDDEQVLDVNETLEEVIELDDSSEKAIADLESRGRFRATCISARDIERFFATKAEPFRPIPWNQLATPNASRP